MSLSPQEQALERIHAEYLEMPDMRLTLEQLQRLCDIERSSPDTAPDPPTSTARDCQARIGGIWPVRFDDIGGGGARRT
jgi:hypothetical protein